MSGVRKGAAVLVAVVMAGALTGAVGLNALGIVGIQGVAAERATTAILAGMDIAAALALFGGVTSIAAFALFLLKKALKKGSKKAIMA